MSVEGKIVGVGRRLIACVRELAVVTAYVAVCVAVALPTVLGTGAAMIWLEERFGLTGYAEFAYFVVATVILLQVFSKLRAAALELGRLVLGPTREMAIN